MIKTADNPLSSAPLADVQAAGKVDTRAKWSKRRTLAFVVGYSLAFWCLAAAVVALVIHFLK